jgi:alpha-beta hydrolase superfamily lysophospholipase
MQRMKRILIAVATGLVFTAFLVTLLAADNAMHVPRQSPRSEAADAIGRQTGATWRSIEVTALDGTLLDAWLFVPHQPNDSVVLVLHGVGDTRQGMLGHAQFLLRGGFTVLTPDSRGHGTSGGDLITYGIREASDVRTWTDWLLASQPAHRLYGVGVSMGAAILLQSLPLEPRFRAIVAESPFATFEEVSYDRLNQVSGVPRIGLWPAVRLGFLYVHLRYGVDLRQASPSKAIRTAHVPILLIHGTADENIPLRHSQELHTLNPAATQLWMVRGAEHVQALSKDPALYSQTVVSWFASHR